MKTVYIVTNVEFGWDCIVGVFDSDTVSYEELEQKFDTDNGYIIFDRHVETNTDDH